MSQSEPPALAGGSGRLPVTAETAQGEGPETDQEQDEHRRIADPRHPSEHGDQQQCAGQEQDAPARLSGIRAAQSRERRIADEDDVGAEDELSENLLAFYQEGVDAIVFTDENGMIQAANESFLGFVDTSHLTRLKSRSIGDFFARGAIDLKVLVENARRVGQMRVYATKLVSEYGSQLPVEISATWLNDRTHPSVVFVIRDASRAEAVRRPGPAMSEEGVASVMELVGSASLKEIVPDTTDVVEKMCIETAVELTRNNRVAAAEMLGLSRQSLYVKLRKYGILSRED